MLEQLIAFQLRIHVINIAKGFWDQKILGKERNKGEMVMLMITELSEAVESHRNDKMVSAYFEKYPTVKQLIVDNDVTPGTWQEVFEGKVKDTVEDELADLMISLLDYAHGWNESLYVREYRKESTGNFANDALRLVHYIMEAFHNSPGKDWGYVIAAIIKFCEWYNIDLLSHIEWKIRYNITRPAMHGKKY